MNKFIELGRTVGTHDRPHIANVPDFTPAGNAWGAYVRGVYVYGSSSATPAGAYTNYTFLRDCDPALKEAPYVE